MFVYCYFKVDDWCIIYGQILQGHLSNSTIWINILKESSRLARGCAALRVVQRVTRARRWGGLWQETRLLRLGLHHWAAWRSGVHRLPCGRHLRRQRPQQFAHSHHQCPGPVAIGGMLLLPGHQEGGGKTNWDWDHGIGKTRRRMARERRGAGSSLVSMETQF